MAIIQECHWTPHRRGLHSAAGVLGWRCKPLGGPAPGHASLRTGPQSRWSSNPGPTNSARGDRPHKPVDYARPRPSARVLCGRHFRCRGAVAVETALRSAAGTLPSSAAHPVPFPWRCRCPEPCGRPTALGTRPAVELVPRGCDARAGTCRRRWGRFARPFSCPRLALARRKRRARSGPEAFVPAWEP